MELRSRKLKMAQESSLQITDQQPSLLQYGNQLHFTLFPKLPTEMRLKIWRAYLCANPRYVDLEVQCTMFPDQRYPNICRGDDAEYNQRIANLKAQFPQTLFVNRESRCETLKLFSFLFNYKGSGQPRRRCYIHKKEGETQAEAEAGCHDIPIWINTKRDILHWTLGDLLFGVQDNGPPGPIAYIDKYAPEFFQKIQNLEVRGFEDCSHPDDTKIPFVFLDPLQSLLRFESLNTIALFDHSFKFRTQVVWESEIEMWLMTPAGTQLKENGIKITVRG